MRIPKPSLSVCPSVCLSVHLSVPREKKSPWLCQYQSYISNWYINGKVFTSTTPWKPKNLIFFKKVWNSNFDLCWIAEITLASSISVVHWQLIYQWKGLHEYYNMETLKFVSFFQKSLKFEFWLVFWLVPNSWNHLRFVYISPTLAIDTSMERSSRVLQHGNPKIWKNIQKSSKFEFWLVFWVVLNSWNLPREKKSPWLRQYQSYIGNWYIKGKVFTSTTTCPWKPEDVNFLKFLN